MKKDRIVDVQNAVERILTSFNYGDVIGYKTLEKLLKARKEEIEFQYKLAVLKEVLIDYGCVLKAVIGEGYRILMPNEIPLEVYKRYGMASMMKFKKGVRILNNVDRNLLNEEEKSNLDEFEKVLRKLSIDSENTLLTASVLINDVKRKELGN